MRLRNKPHRPDLSSATIAVLLGGWGAEVPEDSGHEAFAGGMFELFAEPDAIARLWRQHEHFLRATAARWGWKPIYRAPDGRMLFEAEAVAEGLA